MKTKITNIKSIVTWSEEDQKVITYKDLEILVEDETILQIAPSIEGAEEEIDADQFLKWYRAEHRKA